MVFLFSALVWFLAKSGTTPDQIVVPPKPLVASRDSVNKYNGTVIIIGAGAAGLFAAYTLDYMGHDNYKILEASNRHGGRILQAQTLLDIPLDLGAEYIHADPKVLQDLLLFNDTVVDQTISYQPQTHNAFLRGRRRRRHFWRHFYREYKFYNTTWYSYLNDYIVPYVNTTIQYNAVVQSVDSSNANYITVSTTDGQSYRAEKVIVTVPLAVLDRVQFTPSLSAPMVRAINNVYVAPAVKVVMEFTKQFYSDIQGTKRFVGVMTDVNGEREAYYDPEYYNAVFGKPTQRHALSYLAVGHQAEAMVKLSDEAILAQIMAQLDDMYDGQATKYYKQHVVLNWNNMPYIEGGYSIEWLNDDYEVTVAELARPMSNRIYFAGEHTSADYVATVHGAALSGRRAAEQLWQGTSQKVER